VVKSLIELSFEVCRMGPLSVLEIVMSFFVLHGVGVFVLYSNTSCMKIRCQYFLLDVFATLNRVVSEVSTVLLL
jgi:hypothetical protein